MIKSDEVRPFFSPDSRELGHILAPERIAWVEPDGKERVLLEGYGFHGYAAAAPEGAPVVVVEDLFGWGRAVTAIESDGRHRRLRVDVQRWPSDPKVSPGGGFVAFWERGCRGCPPNLLVLDLAKGAERFRSDAKKATLGGFAWLDARRLVMLERAAEALPVAPDAAPDRRKDKAPLVPVPWSEKPVFPQTLTVVDFGPEPPTLELFHESRNEALSALAASRDGRFLAMARRAEDGKELAVFDIQARVLSTFTALAADNPSLSPNGDFIAFERGGDIAVLERATGTTRVLTNSAFIERYPLFSADGSRVLFESRAEDPNFPKRTLSVIASVSLELSAYIVPRRRRSGNAGSLIQKRIRSWMLRMPCASATPWSPARSASSRRTTSTLPTRSSATITPARAAVSLTLATHSAKSGRGMPR